MGSFWLCWWTFGIINILATPYGTRRPEMDERTFRSPYIDNLIQEVAESMQDKELAEIFANCFPNTLDTCIQQVNTTLHYEDTFVITGDITAMWIRDSTNQVFPYLKFMPNDEALQYMIRGVLIRQTRSLLIDPYANAFSKEKVYKQGLQRMKPGVFENKYELDTWGSFFKLSAAYYRITQDKVPYDRYWFEAVRIGTKLVRDQQPGTEERNPPYKFHNYATEPTELRYRAVGYPCKPNGLVKSAFRPSDDSTLFSYFIPANAMIAVELNNIADLIAQFPVHVLPETVSQIQELRALSASITAAIHSHGTTTRNDKKVFAYEVDGFGNELFMDDANLPSLLSLPYLNFTSNTDPMYQSTREAILSSTTNPYYFESKVFHGVGSPHTGYNSIWPMAIIMQALTSTNKTEIKECLAQLKAMAKETGFMHESVYYTNPRQFTRAWFSWANALFGELILSIKDRYPDLL